MKALFLKTAAALMVAVMLICSSPVGSAEYSSAVISAVAASSKKATIKLKKASLTLVTGDSYTQTLLDKKGKAISKNVKWSCANKKIATVSSKGKITAKKAGKAKITATYKKKKYTFTVTVKNAVLSAKKKTLYTGKSFTLTLKGNGKKISSKNIKFKSSNKKVTTVSSKGKVKAIAPGKATISATYKGKAYKCTVTVKAPYSLLYNSKTIPAGSSFTQALKDSNGKTIDNKKIIWASGNTDIATVSSNGVVIGLTPGKTTITAIYKDKAYKSTVTVKTEPVLIYQEREISAGDSFEQKLKNTDGKFIDNTDIIWSSSDTDVAIVSSKGVVTGVKEGNVTISAIYKNKVYKSTVTVKKAAVQTPVTQAPTTTAPTTQAPTTAAPTTQAPTTATPTTAPATAAPTTKAPTTAAPATTAPTTKAPATQPTTKAPTTAAPTTKAPDNSFVLEEENTTITLKVGETYTLNWQTNISPDYIMCDSDDFDIADVTDSGVITATGVGKTTIYVEVDTELSYETKKVEVVVTEKATEAPTTTQAPATTEAPTTTEPPTTEAEDPDIQIEEKAISVYEGLTHQLKYTFAPSSITVKWTSSDPAVATVNTSGMVTAVSVGAATITASVDYYGFEFTDTCKVVVEPEMVNLAEPISSIYDRSKNTTYIQSFYAFCGGSISAKTLEPNKEKLEYKPEYLDMLEDYVKQISAEGMNLTLENYYNSSNQNLFVSYGLNYAGDNFVVNELAQSYTDDNATLYTMVIRTVYDTSWQYNRYMMLECSKDVAFRDMGLRYNQEPDNSLPENTSLGAGLIRLKDTYKTSDSRFTAKLGETVVLKNGKLIESEAVISGSSSYDIKVSYESLNNLRLYKYSVPSDCESGFIRKMSDFAITEESQPVPYEPTNPPFVFNTNGKYGNSWKTPASLGKEIKDVTIRVMHKDDLRIVVYAYILTGTYDNNAVIEVFSVIDLNK